MLFRNVGSTTILPSSTITDSFNLIETNRYKTGVQNTLISVGLAILFGLSTYYFRSHVSGLQFFAGYLVRVLCLNLCNLICGKSCLYLICAIKIRLNNLYQSTTFLYLSCYSITLKSLYSIRIEYCNTVF